MTSGPAIPPSYGAREAQPLDAMLAQVAGRGWQDFEGTDHAKDSRGTWHEQVNERAEAAAKAAAIVAETKAGKELLEYLADLTVRRPMFVMGMPNPALYAAFREGQNGLFYSLLRLVAVGRAETPAVREGS